uniref:Glutaredoxin domain-containing protein n=1 Tax=Rhizochromulina marina TaxID=1034831 RepID=A0A7S2SDJ4_9STRA|mmetsp:Transcript_28602/g.83701  ORF Transcript_28602/g.83701 Transcript_28602/m.83701 type:complete len:162 (+) Transcript_28602:39-524(+)
MAALEGEKVVPPEGIPAANEGSLRLFMKMGCPFCTKLAFFLAEAGLLSKVTMIYDHPVVREYVKATNEGKCTFPSLEVEPGVVMRETDDIINKFATENGVDVDSLLGLKYFSTGMLKSFMHLFKDKVASTEGGYPAVTTWIADTVGVRPPEVAEGMALKIE